MTAVDSLVATRTSPIDNLSFSTLPPIVHLPVATRRRERISQSCCAPELCRDAPRHSCTIVLGAVNRKWVLLPRKHGFFSVSDRALQCVAVVRNRDTASDKYVCRGLSCFIGFQP